VGTLDGKVVVIAGGTSGIGARSAERFAAEGAFVVIGGRRRDAGESLAARIGSSASFVMTDVSVEAQVERLVGHALDRHGQLDVMMNSAGGPGHWGDVGDVDLDVFQQLMAVHVGGTLAGMKYAARAMVPQGSGSIINMASNSGHQAGWSGIDYSTAKAAIVHLTRCAAVELGENGIRVNSISPAVVLTGIFAKGAGVDADVADRTAGGLAPAFPAMMGDYQAIPRPGTTDDVAEVALWLADDRSSLVTGHDLAVDGGVTAGRPAKVSRAERLAVASLLRPSAS
jgi:NAD(P)-dependent dehydrogenase (short-subunit alcohol dehydrogenase family)